MRHDARHLVAVQALQQPGGRGDGGVGRVAARREGVGLGVVDQVDLGHRHAGAPGQAFHDAVELAAARRVEGLGAIHAQHDLVGVPVGEQIGDRGDAERDHHAGRAADQIADHAEQRGQRRDQQAGANSIHGLLGAARVSAPLARCAASLM